MNAPFKQDARLGRLTTVLGKDVLVLLRFDGSDYVNGLFEYRVEALSSAPNLDFDGLIGTHASVEIESQNDGTRAFDGIVTEATWAGFGENGNKYALTLKPWFWLAGRRRNQRIFHNKTVVQIIEELLAPYSGLGEPALQVTLTGNYPELEYTVQYRESDLAFATRLMERFGISYHFAHKPGSHTLVLTDAIESHPTVPGGEREFKPVDGGRRSRKEYFWEWHPERRLTTGAVRLTDYNFKTPTAAMEVERVGDAAYSQGQIESYDYPGDYLDQGQGKDAAGLRTLQERGQDARHRALGDCTSLGAGMVLTLTGDQVNGVKGADYLCLVARHSYASDGYGSGGAESDGHAYTGEYVLMPANAPLAPERKTQVPLVHGPQTAVVVGEGEIDCDEYGRILVQFHWDLNKAYSMRCRVSQNWASKGWGGMVIPRIGMEVVVEFLEGDADKPLVTGCVYNGKNDPPYPLPAHKTRSTFKTNTHDGNRTGEGFNELRIEDEKDKEEIFVHAQKDMNIEILNDRSKRVEEDQSEFVGNDKSIQVGGDHSEVISGNMSIAVGSNPLATTLMNKTQVLFSKLGGVMEKIKIPDVLNFAKGNFQIFIEKNKSEVVNVASSEIVGVAKSTVVGQSFQTTVGKAMSTLVRGRWESDVGQVQVMRVGDQITIQVGENSTLTMSKEGDIVLKGKHIKLDADKIDMN